MIHVGVRLRIASERWGRSTSLAATIITGLVMATSSSLGDGDVSSRGAACADVASAPSIVFPRAGQQLQTGDDYIFAIPTVEGATAYRWEIYQRGELIVDSTVEPGAVSTSLHRFWWSYIHSAAGRVSFMPRGEWAAVMNHANTSFLVEQGSREHHLIQAGPLAVEVRARVCNAWTDASRANVEIFDTQPAKMSAQRTPR